LRYDAIDAPPFLVTLAAISGDVMDRFARAIAFGLLLSAAALAAGCSGASGLLGDSASAAADGPAKLGNDNPDARPIAVAWTSARAQRCGFNFDAGKLKASYLAYEAKQSGAEQVAKAEKSYDTTFKTIRERVSGDPDYCTDRKSQEIKADLVRHLAGDFTPKLPQAKKVETCGFLGLACPEARRDEAWDAKKFWEEDANKRNAGR
jgi:hypothetical protein